MLKQKLEGISLAKDKMAFRISNYFLVTDNFCTFIYG